MEKLTEKRIEHRVESKTKRMRALQSESTLSVRVTLQCFVSAQNQTVRCSSFREGNGDASGAASRLTPCRRLVAAAAAEPADCCQVRWAPLAAPAGRGDGRWASSSPLLFGDIEFLNALAREPKYNRSCFDCSQSKFDFLQRVRWAVEVAKVRLVPKCLPVSISRFRDS